MQTPYNGGEFGSGIIDLGPKKGIARSIDSTLTSYSTMVSEYTKRRPSFQCDIENAFSGLASILEEWCKGSPVIHGLMSSYFAHSIIWIFRPYQHFYSFHSVSERGNKRAGFPSWSWVGWIACVSNFNSHTVVKLPVLSPIRDVEIIAYNEGKSSLSIDVLDRSATESIAAPTGQNIRINLKSNKLDAVSTCTSTLGFYAERVDWKEFVIKCPSTDYLITFTVSSTQSLCGLLCLVPNGEIFNEVFDQSIEFSSGDRYEWSLIRLYQFRLKEWDNSIDSLQTLLEVLEESGCVEKGFPGNFRSLLQQEDLLYILLVRRQGSCWERVGSGLMFASHWPSMSKRGKIQAYRERIVLV